MLNTPRYAMHHQAEVCLLVTVYRWTRFLSHTRSSYICMDSPRTPKDAQHQHSLAIYIYLSNVHHACDILLGGMSPPYE